MAVARCPLLGLGSTHLSLRTSTDSVIHLLHGSNGISKLTQVICMVFTFNDVGSVKIGYKWDAPIQYKAGILIRIQLQ